MILEQEASIQTVTHTYYTFRHRCVELSEHNGPECPLYTAEEALTSKDSKIRELGKYLKEYQWSFSSWDVFGCQLESNVWHPQNKIKVNPEPHSVWCATRSQGYWTLKLAQSALKYLRKRNARGDYDHKDSYSGCYQRARYEFAIVKVIHTPDTWELV